MPYVRRYTKRRRLTSGRRPYARVYKTPKKSYRRKYVRKTGIEWLDQPDYSGPTYKKDSALKQLNKPKDIVLEVPMSQVIPLAAKAAKAENTTTKVENAALKACKKPVRTREQEMAYLATNMPAGWYDKYWALKKQDPSSRLETTSDLAETDVANRILLKTQEAVGTIGSAVVGVPASVSSLISAGAGKAAAHLVYSPTTRQIIGGAARIAGRVMNSPMISKIGSAISKVKNRISPATKSRIYAAAESVHKGTPVKTVRSVVNTPQGPKTFSYFDSAQKKMPPLPKQPPHYPGSPATPYKPPIEKEYFRSSYDLPQTDYSTMSSGIRRRVPQQYPKSPYPIDKNGNMREGVRTNKYGQFEYIGG